MLEIMALISYNIGGADTFRPLDCFEHAFRLHVLVSELGITPCYISPIWATTNLPADMFIVNIITAITEAINSHIATVRREARVVPVHNVINLIAVNVPEKIKWGCCCSSARISLILLLQLLLGVERVRHFGDQLVHPLARSHRLVSLLVAHERRGAWKVRRRMRAVESKAADEEGDHGTQWTNITFDALHLLVGVYANNQVVT
jgi:hypothetical protein